MKKIMAISLIVFMLVAFSSCAKVIDNENFQTDGYILIKGEEVVPQYVMKINDNEVSLAEFRYYYLNQKSELDGGYEQVWTDYPEYIDSLTKYVEDTLIEVYSIRTLASKNGVSPDYEKVAEEIKEYKEGLSASEYKKGLAAYYLTDNLYEYILQGYDLYNTLFNYYFGENGERSMTDNEIERYVDDNYTHAKHILINPNTTLSDQDYQARLDKILAEAKATEDFDSLVTLYSDDKLMPSYGYYFTDEEMPEEFVLACDDLEEGEVSDLVKTSHGYHIILKLPVDKKDVPELRDVVYNQIFTELVNAEIESAKIEFAPEYEYVSPTTVK